MTTSTTTTVAAERDNLDLEMARILADQLDSEAFMPEHRGVFEALRGLISKCEAARAERAKAYWDARAILTFLQSRLTSDQPEAYRAEMIAAIEEALAKAVAALELVEPTL